MTAIGRVLSATGVILTAIICISGPLRGQGVAPSEQAVVAGIVRLDDAPVTGAVVTLAGPRLVPPRVAISDPAGRFVFANVVPGEFVLTVRKPPYVLSRLDGVTWIGDEIPISPAAERRLELSLALARGGAIEGVIRDPFGQPLSGATVAVFRKRREPSATPVLPVASARTDSRGRYRIYGLRPAEYVVQASAPTSFGSLGVELVDDVDFRNVERATRESRPIDLPPRGDHEAVQYMATYFGGTVVENDAVALTVEAGREQLGIDIQLGLSQAVTLRGLVTYSDGRPAPESRVSLFPDQPGVGLNGSTVVSVDPDGGFVKEGVAPGRYRLVAQTMSDRSTVERAAVEVQVPGSDTSSIRLVMVKPATLQGRLLLDEVDPTSRTKILKSARVTLQRAGRGILVSSFDIAQSPVSETGSFAFMGILPGNYALTLEFPGALDVDRPGLEFIQIGGAQLPDGIVPVSASPENILEVYLSTRQAQLSGTVVGWTSGVVKSLSVLVFPAEAAWRRSSNRIRMVQVQESGSYRVQGLAAGAYLVALVPGVDLRGVLELSTFEEVARMALRVEIGQGELRTLDLRVGQR